MEPVLGPGHRHVEQAAILLLRALPVRRGERFGDRIAGFPAALPDQDRRRRLRPQHGVALDRRLRPVGEDDDRCLQPLGAMHGQHPDLVAGGLFQIPLDLGPGGAEPGDETL